VVELAREGSAGRANARVLLDDGMGYEAIATEDTIRSKRRLHEGYGIEFVTDFGYKGRACHFLSARGRAAKLARLL
jgi:hypothetical protein